MFGRRDRSRKRPQPAQRSSVDLEGDIEHISADRSHDVADASPLATEIATSDELPPLRAPGAGSDSGLAAIEAEFQISDEDIALLELGALEFAPPPSPIEIKLTEDRDELDATMQRLIGDLSARLESPLDLQPFAMLPARCWEGEHRETLVEILGLTPWQTWNTLPLAGDAATAEVLGIIEHPGGESLHAVDPATSFLDDIIAKMRSRCEQATFEHDGVDSDALEQAREQARDQIRGLARHVAGVIIGTSAVAHTRATFFGD